MEMFTVLSDKMFSFVGWMGDGSALYQHESGRLLAIQWHPDQEMLIDSTLTHPAKVISLTGGSNSRVELTSDIDRFEEAIDYVARGEAVFFPKKPVVSAA